MAGPPKGSKNALRPSEWRNAIRYALINYEDSDVARGKALKAIAKKLIQLALKGDHQAIKEIGERTDGKAVQFVDTTFRDVTNAAELTDQELAGIAASGREGTSQEKSGKEESDSVH